MYSWSLVVLFAMNILLCSCSVLPSIPRLLPSLEPSIELPAGTDQAEAASFYRKKAAQYEAAANVAEAEAKAAKLEARQEWCWWMGFTGVIVGAVAFALAFAYPLASFLRIGGVAAMAAGGTILLIGEALPYFWILSLGVSFAIAAIITSLLVQHRGLKVAVRSWKEAAEALPWKTREALDEDSLKRQGPMVETFLSKHLEG